ncbi:MAG: polysaccharide biosynthesis C-terminal domain-containing protein [Clostridia bacterium]|nr:polysaccharide biosynthesis C-terminal domain-containing protein [Clostridia bacterium]
MNRKTKLMLNSASSLLYQLITIVCGFILPRFLLTYYGSAVNGLVSSITQFLGFISLAECGVGAVVQSTLYKPLAENDITTVSKVVMSSERFFKRIAYILLAYIGVLMAVYPLLTMDSFDYLFTLVLLLVISVSTFARYYIGMTYKILLDADQLGFVQYIIHTVALVFNTVFCILLMQWGASIHIVKLTTSLIFVLQPVLLSVIAKKKYKIDRSIKLTEEPIKQKWNGLAQHIAGVVLINTDTVVLTLFSSLENVSVYAVYNIVVNGIRQLILSLTNGIRSMFGNMLAKNETDELNRSFNRVEWFMHTLVIFVFSVTAFLIVPFVKVYTANITDADYIVPVFAYMITLAQAIYCLRLPYYVLVNAAGHYKETQTSAIIEAVINVSVSVALVFPFGLTGVAIGTFAAMLYRTLYLVWYLKNNILFRRISCFVKHLIADMCSALLLLAFISAFPSLYRLSQLSYSAWVVLALKVTAASVITLIIVNGIFYSKEMKKLLFRKNANK